MARTKKKVELTCIKCEDTKEKNSNFYNSNSPLHAHSGKAPICKKCIKEIVDYDNMDTIYSILQQLDIKFDYSYWEQALNSKFETLPRYITMANSLGQFKGTGWKDSVFSDDDKSSNSTKPKDNQPIKKKADFEITDQLINKWGEGYTPEEYRAFERKYQLLRNNYQEKTAMHTEALLTYIRYRVKEELSTAQGDIKSAKDWGALAQKAAQDAKINPSQLSKSDLSDGLDTFGQLVRTVETAEDIIPILPRFKERPQDKVDFTIWCYINYIRDLKGLPLAEYEEIYKFYEERKKEYGDRYDFLQDDEE